MIIAPKFFSILVDENFFKKVYLNNNLTVPSGNNIYILKKS